jgi:glutathione synthase/RimK-type ligase-like ATP-grasp enzyme
MSRQIAFVTYQKHPEITQDDALAVNALSKLDITLAGIPWNKSGIDWRSFDAVVLRSCWDYYHHHEQFLAWINLLEENGVTVLNEPSVIRWNAEKTYLRDLSRVGVNVVPTVYALNNSSLSIADVLTQQAWDRAVVKPTVSGTSLHTWLTPPVAGGAALDAALNSDQHKLDILLAERNMMLQEYLPEIESAGELSLIYFDNEYSHAIRKVPRAGDFRVQDDFGGTSTAVTPDAAIKRQADEILVASNRSSVYARVDGVIRDGVFLLMELELIEPHLFLAHDPNAATRFAHAIAQRIRDRAA